MPQAGTQAFAWLKEKPLIRTKPQTEDSVQTQVKSHGSAEAKARVKQGCLRTQPIYAVRQIKSALPPLRSSPENPRQAEHVGKDHVVLKVRKSWELGWT